MVGGILAAVSELDLDDDGPLDPVRLQRTLRQGRPVRDHDFDRLYPPAHRHRSSFHWTPVDVALRVCEMLAGCPGGQVLDVGAGVGKACLIGALVGPLRWTGVERDGRMVQAARRAARALAIDDRVTFVHDEVDAVDWRAFGGLYLFNPFGERLWGGGVVDPFIRRAGYLEDVHAAERQLAAMPVGAEVVTFCGYGGEMPAGYELLEEEPMESDRVCLWRRR